MEGDGRNPKLVDFEWVRVLFTLFPVALPPPKFYCFKEHSLLSHPESPLRLKEHLLFLLSRVHNIEAYSLRFSSVVRLYPRRF
jgi:hypothetical protein